MVMLAVGARLGFNLFYCANFISAISVVALSAILLKIAKIPLMILSFLAVCGFVDRDSKGKDAVESLMNKHNFVPAGII